ncbi:hypothetical protein SAY86_016355 [Trapa natans]|uniref:Transcription factor GTE8 n=1 Tax=Trapa natans TaxID=22666 RepID=A0AAN7R1B9_TRANT|nr:hypothetical protein SAY86_016355 [Trapa natans]
MVVRKDHFPRGYHQNTFNGAGESEGSGSSGRIDSEFTASEDSGGPTRKCISLNSDKGGILFVPSEVLPTSSMLPSEKIALINRLKLELEQIRILQKKIELQRSGAVAVSSSSDLLSCSNGRLQSGAIRKSSALDLLQEKKVNTFGGKSEQLKQSFSGKIESTKETTAPRSADASLMNQCDTLLKRLMSHQYAWVFNKPVDVKALNIPDYFTIIKNPMDFSTIKGKIISKAYSTPLEFAADVRLTFTNAMTYNPPGNDVYIMADALSKFFEVRWKTLEKKLVVTVSQNLPSKSEAVKEKEKSKPLPPAKKRKISSIQYEVQKPVQPVMTDEEKHGLGRLLENIMADVPEHIIDFLRENSLNGQQCGEEEIEIDIDDLSNDTLFTLRKLLDEYLQEKQKSRATDEQCEIEIFHESGFSNSSMQPSKVNGDEDVDIGVNEPPVSSYQLVEKEKDDTLKETAGVSEDASSDSDLIGSADSQSDDCVGSTPKNARRKTIDAEEIQMDEKRSPGSLLDVNGKSFYTPCIIFQEIYLIVFISFDRN